MLQNATSLRKSAPGPPNNSDKHVSCTAPAMENASLQILFKCPTPAIAFGNIWTSKSVPNPSVFYAFDFEMCFAPQRRALFRLFNFQKCSERRVLLAFSLANVLCATTACPFSTSQLPKVLRTWCVFNFFNLFHLHMCFSPKRRALFRHLNFQKWSEREVLLAFSLANVLRATTACNFSSLIWPAGSAPPL